MSEGRNSHTLSWHGLTDKGRFRKNNEDAFLALNFDEYQVRFLGKHGSASLGADEFIFAVSDGMGGANAGEFASRIAVQKISELMPKHYQGMREGNSELGLQVMTELFKKIHMEMVIMGRFYEECRGMGATLSLCWFTPKQVIFGHIGDSRIYHLPVEGPMVQMTEDHTHVGWLFREGKINERQARSHPRLNVLDKALGGRYKDVEPQVGAVDYGPGDRFVLCTDGVTGGVWDRNLEGMIREPSERIQSRNPAERLIDESMSAGARDNLTSIVVEVT